MNIPWYNQIHFNSTTNYSFEKCGGLVTYAITFSYIVCARAIFLCLVAVCLLIGSAVASSRGSVSFIQFKCAELWDLNPKSQCAVISCSHPQKLLPMFLFKQDTRLDNLQLFHRLQFPSVL